MRFGSCPGANRQQRACDPEEEANQKKATPRPRPKHNETDPELTYSYIVKWGALSGFLGCDERR